MVSDVFSSASTTQDDKVKKELVQIVATRLLFATLYPFHPLGLPDPSEEPSKQEQNMASIMRSYMRDLWSLFENYFTSLDLTSSLVADTISLSVALKQAPGLKAEIIRAYEQKHPDGDSPDIDAASSDLDLEEDGADEGNDAEISIPDDIPLPDGCCPDHFKKVAADLTQINTCYYLSWIEGEKEAEAEEPGVVSSFNAAYLWVKQALDDLRGRQPGQLYPIKVAPPAMTLPAQPSRAGTFTPPSVSCRLQ